jgi:solute carrier family 25 phosphate transporter 3
MSASAPPQSTGSSKLDALKQNVTAQTPEKLSGINLYSRFAFAGAVCCAVTHGGLTPVDVYVLDAWRV